MMLAMVLSIGCMAVPVPVAASENVAEPTGVEARAFNYSPLCPTCGELGKYVSEVNSGLGYILVYRNCPKHGLYHHYSL